MKFLTETYPLASAEDYIPDLEVEDETEETDFIKLADDAPVVKFVNKVLFDAIKQVHQISTSNPMSVNTEFAFAQTVYCRRLFVHPRVSRRVLQLV